MERKSKKERATQTTSYTKLGQESDLQRDKHRSKCSSIVAVIASHGSDPISAETSLTRLLNRPMLFFELSLVWRPTSVVFYASKVFLGTAERAHVPSELCSWSKYIKSTHPSIVMHWKTTRSAAHMWSKCVKRKLKSSPSCTSHRHPTKARAAEFPIYAFPSADVPAFPFPTASIGQAPPTAHPGQSLTQYSCTLHAPLCPPRAHPSTSPPV